MLKVGISFHPGLFALIMAASACPALAQTTATVPAVANTIPAKLDPIKELKKTDLTVGTGKEAIAGKTVTVNYTGWLYTYNPSKPDHKGSKFYSSLDNGVADTFPLGTDKKVKGLSQGITGMKIGGKRTVIVPAELGYGAHSMWRGVIPANSALLYEIELIDVQ